jgi:hypothetical protein
MSLSRRSGNFIVNKKKNNMSGTIQQVQINDRFERNISMRTKVTHMSVEDFLKSYIDFLLSHRLKERSAKTYAGKLRKFLKNGYSVADLCGAVEQLIKRHGRGGADYNPKDHGNTYNALKWLLRFLQVGHEQDILISYQAGWSSFPRVDKHMVGYCISGKTIEVRYNIDFSPEAVETKSIPDSNYSQLIAIMRRYASYLSDSHTLTRTHHGEICKYEYRFENYEGIECGCLFDDESAMAEYQAWLAPFVN